MATRIKIASEKLRTNEAVYQELEDPMVVHKNVRGRISLASGRASLALACRVLVEPEFRAGRVLLGDVAVSDAHADSAIGVLRLIDD